MPAANQNEQFQGKTLASTKRKLPRDKIFEMCLNLTKVVNINILGQP